MDFERYRRQILIEVIVNGKKHKIETKGKIKGKDIFKMLNLNEEEYLLIVNGRLTPIEEPIKNSSKIELLPVISGG